MSGPRFGLRFIRKGRQVVLVQIAGGGRLRLRSDGKEWWEKPAVVDWEVYEASQGERFSSPDDAAKVAFNLLAAADKNLGTK